MEKEVGVISRMGWDIGRAERFLDIVEGVLDWIELDLMMGEWTGVG